MKLYNTENRRTELTREEYLKICENHNKKYWYDPTHQYDLMELVYLDLNQLTITEDMLDESETGFWMFSITFYDLFAKYTNWPLIHDEGVIKVTI